MVSYDLATKTLALTYIVRGFDIEFNLVVEPIVYCALEKQVILYLIY